MKRLSIIFSIVFFQAVAADVPPEQKPEVAHLLDFVRQSGCLLIRNGSEHSGEEAVSHIQKKYDYFKDDITSTEAFVEYSATKSTMSGKDYTIRCPDKNEIRTQDWLLNELNDFRKKTGSDAPVR
ncbi:MAG: DUF5329 domain-containing protein [Gammaproteobacteria bacterium]|nr:DUF5329 domain-containing protein [Gammaproteobacteria bacterium]